MIKYLETMAMTKYMVSLEMIVLMKERVMIISKEKEELLLLSVI
jgi:hypothetical protein